MIKLNYILACSVRAQLYFDENNFIFFFFVFYNALHAHIGKYTCIITYNSIIVVIHFNIKYSEPSLIKMAVVNTRFDYLSKVIIFSRLHIEK